MTTSPVAIYPTSTSSILVGGQPQTLIYGPVFGGMITNPASSEDQGVDTIEVLYVDIFGPASESSPTSVAIQPGESYTIPSITTNVSISAATTGHKFSAFAMQPPPSVTPAELFGTVNPCIQQVIPSYLYQQYADDDDLQAFVSAYNTLAQEYVSWLNEVMLPVYTNPAVTGGLLDWVGFGLYGVPRPALSTGNLQVIGPFDTYHLDEMAFAARRTLAPSVFTLVNDDFYKRILTWKLYKGDGKQINIKWLKRRILRFLLGVNGEDVNVADTQQVSVTFGGNIITLTVVTTTEVTHVQGPAFNSQLFNQMGFNLLVPQAQISQSVSTYQRDNQININFLSQVITSLSGTYFNSFLGNGALFNGFAPTAIRHITPLPNIAIFKEAVDQGVLDMPFQFKVVVNIR